MDSDAANTRNESSGVALSGMILAFVGLICSMLDNWRVIGMVIAFIALIISVFAISRINKTGGKKLRAVTGIGVSIAAVLISAYFLYLSKPAENGTEPVPSELQNGQEQVNDHENALQKLEGLTDSSASK